MKGVVDEKLSATLEQRLGEKFKTVSEHLESVHKGLGEMQSLASGVGDLKRVLTNVKARGSWGEMRLGQLLEDMLPGQFEAQVQVRAGAGERVDYAVKLPGRSDDGTPLWLPIDCKFPQEDYDRLLSAHERADAVEVEACAMALERAVKLQGEIDRREVCASAGDDALRLHVPAHRGSLRRGGAAAGLGERPADGARRDDHRAQHPTRQPDEPADGLPLHHRGEARLRSVEGVGRGQGGVRQVRRRVDQAR